MCSDSVIDFVDRNGRRLDSEARLNGVDAALKFVNHARRCGVEDLYFTNTPTVDVRYYAVGFENGYDMAIKACCTPTPETLTDWLKGEVERSGPVFEYYEIDEDELYSVYDCDNLGAWPVFGLDAAPGSRLENREPQARPMGVTESTDAGMGAGCPSCYLVDKTGFSLTSGPQFKDINEGEVFLRFAREHGVDDLYLTMNPAGYAWIRHERTGRYVIYLTNDEREVLDITGDVTAAAIEGLLRERPERDPNSTILGYIEVADDYELGND